jgi:hypothetical protein
MFKLNTTKANNIEKILELVNTMVVSIQSLWRYSAAAFSICGFGGMV